MLIKTHEASGLVLDWMVAVASKHPSRTCVGLFDFWDYCFNPSTNWVQGGSIIEREKISVWWDGVWHAKYDGCRPDQVQDADAPLIAAMRCYVASKLGDEVEVPDELVNEETT